MVEQILRTSMARNWALEVKSKGSPFCTISNCSKRVCKATSKEKEENHVLNKATSMRGCKLQDERRPE
jgi:hypothetical protein